MSDSETKICAKCKVPKLLTKFYKNKTAADGLESYCIQCKRKYHQDHYTTASLSIDEQLLRQQENAIRAKQISELKTLLSAKNSQDRYISAIEKYTPILKIPDLDRSFEPKKNKPTHKWVIVLSDLHVGQKTAALETGGLFEQTTELALAQIRSLWSKIRLLTDIANHAINIDELWILQLGDLVEGDGMRQSQATGIDELVAAQTMDTVDILSEFINNCLGIFPKVFIRNVGGNHDRLSQKPGNAGLGELGYHDTYAWLIAEIEQRLFKDAIADGRLDLKNSKSFFDGDIIAGQKVVYEHGASFRASTGSYGGVAWYPIAQVAMKYQQMLDGADLVIMGHHHIPACLPMGRGWEIMNGALPPSTAWVQSSFKKVTLPCQVLLELHPEHGLLTYKPIHLPHPNSPAPGSFWTERQEQYDNRNKSKTG